MLLDDAFEHRRVARAIPRAFGIDDRNRPAFADAQAVRFRAADAARFRKAEFLQPRFQVVPRDERSLLVAALRRRLIGAEKDVTLDDGEAELARQIAETFTSSSSV